MRKAIKQKADENTARYNCADMDKARCRKQSRECKRDQCDIEQEHVADDLIDGETVIHGALIKMASMRLHYLFTAE